MDSSTLVPAGGAGSIRSVFAFFSSRLGCLGSLVVSIVGTIVLLLILRAL